MAPRIRRPYARISPKIRPRPPETYNTSSLTPTIAPDSEPGRPMVSFTGGLKLPPDLLEALNAQAEASGLSRQALIRSALRQYLGLPDSGAK
jgi:hypothetical protein